MAKISDEDVPAVLKAIAHYSAYLKATNRDASIYDRISADLERKPAAKEEATPRTRKRA